MKVSKKSKTSIIAPDEELMEEVSHSINDILDAKFLKIKEIREMSYLRSREEVVSTRKGVQQGVMEHLEVAQIVTDSLPQKVNAIMEIKSNMREHEKTISNVNTLDEINKFIQQNEKELQDEVKYSTFNYTLTMYNKTNNIYMFYILAG